jgi:hypothetical protein
MDGDGGSSSGVEAENRRRLHLPPPSAISYREDLAGTTCMGSGHHVGSKDLQFWTTR